MYTVAGRGKITTTIAARVTTARGKKYYYLMVKEKIDGKWVERKLRVSREDYELVKEAHSFSKKEGGMSKLEPHSLGYIFTNMGGGFYTVRPIERGLILATKTGMRCLACRSNNCDHVTIFSNAI